MQKQKQHHGQGGRDRDENRNHGGRRDRLNQPKELEDVRAANLEVYYGLDTLALVEDNGNPHVSGFFLAGTQLPVVDERESVVEKFRELVQLKSDLATVAEAAKAKARLAGKPADEVESNDSDILAGKQRLDELADGISNSIEEEVSSVKLNRGKDGLFIVRGLATFDGSPTMCVSGLEVHFPRGKKRVELHKPISQNSSGVIRFDINGVDRKVTLIAIHGKRNGKDVSDKMELSLFSHSEAKRIVVNASADGTFRIVREDVYELLQEPAKDAITGDEEGTLTSSLGELAEMHKPTTATEAEPEVADDAKEQAPVLVAERPVNAPTQAPMTEKSTS